MMQSTVRRSVSAAIVFIWAGVSCAGEGSAVSVELVRDGAPTASVVIAKQAT